MLFIDHNDCHSFFKCFDATGIPVKMSCGFLHFNPLTMTCDWPANVIKARPECGKAFKSFDEGLFFGRFTTTTTTTTDKPKNNDETKEPRLFIVNGIPKPKKRLPTELEVVLKPELFADNDYAYENGDRLSGNRIEIQSLEDLYSDEDIEDYEDPLSSLTTESGTSTTSTTKRIDDPLVFPTESTNNIITSISEPEQMRETSSRDLDGYDITMDSKNGDSVFFPKIGLNNEEPTGCKDIEDFTVEEIVAFIKGNIEKFTEVIDKSVVKALTKCHCPYDKNDEGARSFGYSRDENGIHIPDLPKRKPSHQRPTETRSLEPPEEQTTPLALEKIPTISIEDLELDIPQSSTANYTITEALTTTSSTALGSADPTSTATTETISTDNHTHAQKTQVDTTTAETSPPEITSTVRTVSAAKDEGMNEASITKTPEISTYFPIGTREDIEEMDGTIDDMTTQSSTTQKSQFSAITYYPMGEKKTIKTKPTPTTQEPRVLGRFENTKPPDFEVIDPDTSDKVADCISQFLKCLDEEDVYAVTQHPTVTNGCYEVFQDCSGSVILIPDLYIGSVPYNKTKTILPFNGLITDESTMNPTINNP